MHFRCKAYSQQIPCLWMPCLRSSTTSIWKIQYNAIQTKTVWTSRDFSNRLHPVSLLHKLSNTFHSRVNVSHFDVTPIPETHSRVNKGKTNLFPSYFKLISHAILSRTYSVSTVWRPRQICQAKMNWRKSDNGKRSVFWVLRFCENMGRNLIIDSIWDKIRIILV
jgi:hypothetical protein